jgi:hypothetical protein
MDEKKDFSIFDPEQVDIIANLFADIIEKPSKDWDISQPVLAGQYMVSGKFTLVDEVPPQGATDVTTIKVHYVQVAKLDLEKHQYDAPRMPDSIVIKIDDRKEYGCDFGDAYLKTLPGIKRLQQVLHKKALDLLEQLLEDTKLEGKNLVGMLKAVKEEQKG